MNHAAASAPRTAELTLNQVWLAGILELVVQAGARRAVLCPGARSAALVMAIRAHPAFVDVLICSDERSGAYAALGMIKASREPVVVVTTSGSAVANVLPALTEADECDLPLLLLSCDRPRHLRDSGFGQMIDQIGACRSSVRFSLDLPDPLDDAALIADVKHQVAQALAYRGGAHPGPVHINIPLTGRYDSMEPVQVSAQARQAAAVPLAPQAAAVPARPPHDIEALAARLKLRPNLKGLIIAGPDCEIPLPWLSEFVESVGYPVLADASSGLRGTGLACVLSGNDALVLPSQILREAPELVIRFGLAPISPLVQGYLQQHPCPTLKIASAARDRDFLHPQLENLASPSRAELQALAGKLACNASLWLQAWQHNTRTVAGLRRSAMAQLAWGELLAAQAIFEHDGYDFLHVGNSMSIRHADILYHTRANRQQVYANRGACGIDGTLGTFLGEAAARRDTGLLVLGDLAFLHDLPALATAQRHRTSACICVINNAGGAIFDFLPIASHADYQASIRNPYQVDICTVAAAFGLAHARAGNRLDLSAALDAARRHPGVSIIEVVVPPGSVAKDIGTIARVLNAVALKNTQ